LLFQNGHLHQGFLEHERHQHGHGAYGPPKPPPTQVIIHSSLKYSFLPEELGNKQTHKLTLNQICFNTNKFLDWVSGFLDPESGFSGKNPVKYGKNQV